MTMDEALRMVHLTDRQLVGPRSQGWCDTHTPRRIALATLTKEVKRLRRLAAKMLFFEIAQEITGRARTKSTKRRAARRAPAKKEP